MRILTIFIKHHLKLKERFEISRLERFESSRQIFADTVGKVGRLI